MNSKTIYTNLCKTKQSSKNDWSYQSGLHRHHILPKHSGGLDEDSNYTYLTLKEHIIAHYLLWRIYKNPNDLRAMNMLGAKLTPSQRKKIGEFCRDNKIGMFSASISEETKKLWRAAGLDNQKRNYELYDEKNSFYYWSTLEGRKERAKLGGDASMKSDNNHEWKYWMSKEGRTERGKLGAEALRGRRQMYRPGDSTFRRVKQCDIEESLKCGYIFGSPIPGPNSKKRKIKVFS